jgi:hypothetical protein
MVVVILLLQEPQEVVVEVEPLRVVMVRELLERGLRFLYFHLEK